MRPQFAVTREDPRLEATLIDRFGIRSIVCVASGGCTPLTLARRPDPPRVRAFDLNPAQLAHCRAKAACVDLKRLNVGTAEPAALNQRGAFEGLFRLLRQALVEFVMPVAELEAFFAGDPACLPRWQAHPYWPTAFALAFSDPLLLTMFGPAAIQHAAPGSYPAYFQRAFERGLAAPDAARNPFLQHVLLGRYLPDDAPDYTSATGGVIEWIEGDLLAVPVEDAGLFSLSNIFDWSDDALVAAWAGHLAAAPRGARVLLRQLNNTRDLRRFFEPAWRFDDALGAALHAADRSLFYNRVEVGVRV